ncbi:MAG: DUF1611 domain-containing protein [Flavihumibacter sp.]|jgi:uncharacterized NAD-dependent epimerase/dehydratase family protein|nr:DUF1611 domain-containing protein [Flavihumibacter sp.]
MNRPKAIVITNGLLDHSDAKTAHGLIRGTERFEIAGIIDFKQAGRDAGEVLDGKHRGIPVYADLDAALAAHSDLRYCIIGVATVGGILPPDFLTIIELAIRNRISIVNGLHDYLNERSYLVTLAAEYGVELIDIRRPKKRADLHFWSGEIFSVTAPTIAVLGMDCAMGKRTTCRLIRQSCETAGIRAQMIYTGQTGWLQGGQYGFIFDSTLNDFISGELEHAILQCWKEANPDIILLEGQSALRNPSGPAGSEFLVSGNAKYTVLVHAPKRKHFEHTPAWGEIPSVKSEIELIRHYGSTVIAVALNTEDCTTEESFEFQRKLEAELNLPVLLPLQEGVQKLLPVLQNLLPSQS